MSKFQIILTVFFVLAVVVAIAVLALFKGSDKNGLPPLTVWGTLGGENISAYFDYVSRERKEPFSLNYIQKSEDSISREFVEALATGNAPDLIIFPQKMFVKEGLKLTTIPFESFPLRDFKNTYPEIGEMYIRSDGIIGVPFMIDPLVMYWNRDIFTATNIALYPRTWADIENILARIFIKDERGNIKRTAVALGESTNISHVREILGSMFMQAGNPVITTNKGSITSAISLGEYKDSASNALDFYTSFANPSSYRYSWNRSLPGDKEMFLSGQSAIYFGFASELEDIRNKNPNLNFDIAPFPRINPNLASSAYAETYAFAIPKNTPYQSQALSIIFELISPNSLTELNRLNYLPPIRRDMIALGTKDPYMEVFYNQVLTAKTWYDPDHNLTSSEFIKMIDNVQSGRRSLKEALEDAHDNINAILDLDNQ